MILVFPQATKKFNKLFTEMIKKSEASFFLDRSFSCYNMKQISKVLLIILNDKFIEDYLYEYLSKLSLTTKFKIIVLKKETLGSICTLLMAIPYLKNKSVMISSLDQIILGNKIDVNNLLNKQNTKICVPTIKSNNKTLCYVLRDDLGRAIQLFEKKKISNEAILGVYLFKNFSDFFNTSNDLLIKYRGFSKKVFYSSDIINSLIKKHKVYFPLLELSYLKIRSIKTLKKIK